MKEIFYSKAETRHFNDKNFIVLSIEDRLTGQSVFIPIPGKKEDPSMASVLASKFATLLGAFYAPRSASGSNLPDQT